MDALNVYEKEGDITLSKVLFLGDDTVAAPYVAIHYKRLGTVLVIQLFSNKIAV